MVVRTCNRRVLAACVAALLALGTLSACGQKGDLYRPEDRQGSDEQSQDDA
ncbi:MAG: lipoprotein [Gammaproteobacteria bacterium]|nr:lipoprotein [Gammaproteobacteria bacterium]